MKQIDWKNKRWIWYTIYCLLLTVALLYYRFPDEAFKEYFQGALNRITPSLRASFEGLSLSFPLSFKIFRAELSSGEYNDKPVFKIDIIRLRPGFISFLKGDSEYFFRCSAYGGTLKGRALFVKGEPGGSCSASIALEDLFIDDNSPVPAVIRDRLWGTINGNITYNGDNISLVDGTGDAVLTLSAGAIKFSKPVFDLEAIDFNNFLLNLALKDQSLNILNVELKGEKMSGKVSGTVSLGKDLMESRLNLKGTIEAYADLFKSSSNARDTISFFKQGLKDGEIHFNIKGTIKDPRINFI